MFVFSPTADTSSRGPFISRPFPRGIIPNCLVLSYCLHCSDNTRIILGGSNLSSDSLKHFDLEVTSETIADPPYPWLFEDEQALSLCLPCRGIQAYTPALSETIFPI